MFEIVTLYYQASPKFRILNSPRFTVLITRLTPLGLSTLPWLPLVQIYCLGKLIKPCAQGQHFWLVMVFKFLINYWNLLSDEYKGTYIHIFLKEKEETPIKGDWRNLGNWNFNISVHWQNYGLWVRSPGSQ